MVSILLDDTKDVQRVPYSEKGIALVRLSYVSVAADHTVIPVGKLKSIAFKQKSVKAFQRIWSICYRYKVSPLVFFELMWPKLIGTVRRCWGGSLAMPTMFGGSFAEDTVVLYLKNGRVESTRTESIIRSINDDIYQVKVLCTEFGEEVSRLKIVRDYAGLFTPVFLAWLLLEGKVKEKAIPSDLLQYVVDSKSKVLAVRGSFSRKLDDPEFIEWLSEGEEDVF